MKEEQKLNLICRMAGNIFTKSNYGNSKDSVIAALAIFKEVERKLKQEKESEQSKCTNG